MVVRLLAFVIVRRLGAVVGLRQMSGTWIYPRSPLTELSARELVAAGQDHVLGLEAVAGRLAHFAVIDALTLARLPLRGATADNAAWIRRRQRAHITEELTAFVRGYGTVVPPNQDEIADAVVRLWWKRNFDFWQLDFHYDRGDTSCDDLFLSGEATMQWWTDHREEVLHAFAGCGRR
jgi:hypothetical protein